MIPINSPFPPGHVIVVSPDLARFSEFSMCLEELLVPGGTSFKWAAGTSIDANRNIAISKMKEGAHWVYMLDDDHSFKPDTLMRLLDRMMNDERIDVLQALCFTRKPPFLPFAYRKDAVPHPWGTRYISIPLDELPQTGAYEVDAVGMGSILVRRQVFDMMPYPWCETGKTSRDQIGEDLHFCTKSKELGFRVWVDCDTRTGHMNTHATWPVVQNGQWHAGIDLGQDIKIAVPQSAWANARFDEITVPVEKR